MPVGGFHTSCWGTEFIISPEPPKTDEAGITISVLWDQERFCNLLKAHVISLRDLGFRTPRFPQTHAGDSVPCLWPRGYLGLGTVLELFWMSQDLATSRYTLAGKLYVFGKNEWMNLCWVFSYYWNMSLAAGNSFTMGIWHLKGARAPLHLAEEGSAAGRAMTAQVVQGPVCWLPAERFLSPSSPDLSEHLHWYHSLTQGLETHRSHLS